MSDDALRSLATEAGLALRWRDAHGREQDTAPDVLRAVLAALDLPADNDAAIAESRARVAPEAGPQALRTAVVGRPILLTGPEASPGFRLELEDGGVVEGRAERLGAHWHLPAVKAAGYHRLLLGDAAVTLAVSPERCFGVADAMADADARSWGLAAQLYGLRRPGDGGVGDFTALEQFVRAAAGKGADAVAISPVHAQFSADPQRFSPYAPSSRLFLNVLHVDPALLGEHALRDALARSGSAEEFARLEALPLVDWPGASRARLRLLRALFDAFPGDPAFDSFRAESGEALESHARFEALHAFFYEADPARWDWRDWSEEYRDPRGPRVAAFARDNAREVDFHAFLQWLADRGLAGAQRAAKEAGARIGLITDLAVGTDGGGSHGWSRPREMLHGLTIGAPPDIFSPLGQSWGISSFSPRGLQQGGYGAFIEMLRATMRHAGGLRIDHAMGLARLWVVPDGASAQDGAYLHYPVDDMLRLVALESRRHRAIVVGEDLGTLPEGFRTKLDEADLMGLRVLYFEQNNDCFTPPAKWSAGAVAVTTTHDLPTVSGWWRERDIDWRLELGLLGEDADGAAQRAERERERPALWRAMLDSGAAQGAPPPPQAGESVADAAAAHVGSAACRLALLPVEDALALAEAPNLPGTTTEHPNWRRRIPCAAAAMLEDPACAARLAAFARTRQRGDQS